MKKVLNPMITPQKRLAVNLQRSLLVVLACLSCTVNSPAQKVADGKSIFYAVTGNGLRDTSWIFGTYHLINNSFLDAMPNVIRSFNKAQGVTVEIVMDSSKMQSVMAMGMLQNKTLASLVSKQFFDTLDHELKGTLGISATQMNMAKPISVMLTLSMVNLIKNNEATLAAYKGVPLDAWFAKEGKQRMKKVTPLETIEGQMQMLFNRNTDEEQATQLQAFIRNKTEMNKIGNDLLSYWFKQDLIAMENLYANMLKLSGEEDFLIKNRNDEWMQVLPGIMSNQSTFVGVGALHLAGPHGIVQQLKNSGYNVTPLKTTF